MSRKIIPSYEGLESLSNPDSFAKCLLDVTRALEGYFRCMVELADNGEDARQAFLAAFDATYPEDRSKRGIVNVLVHSLITYLKAGAGEFPEPYDDRYARFHDRLKRLPHVVIAVGFGLSIYQIELGLADGVCQVGIDTVFDLVDSLEKFPDHWMFEQFDILHACPVEP
jgi:hypothetical protein